jgi:hypothetical protein
MADVTVTAADVKPLPGAVVRRYAADATLYAGNAVYLKSDGEVAQVDADAAASARAIGIAVAGPEGKTTFLAGDALDVVVGGPLAGFSSLTPGGYLFASTTAGAIANAAATASGDYIWAIGYAEAAARMFVQPWTYDIVVIS